MGPVPQSIVSPLTVTSPGKRPWFESNRKRCALVSAGARSLMATTLMSSRSPSTIARSTMRPVRPKPLIATLVDISVLRPAYRHPDLCKPLHRLESNSLMYVKTHQGEHRRHASLGLARVHGLSSAVALDRTATSISGFPT